MTPLRSALLLALLPLLTHCAPTEEQRIKNLLDEANVCNQAEDCALIGSKCPFGCEIYVHKDRADELRPLVENYDSQCEYGCIQTFGVECVQNRCEPIIAHPAAGETGGACEKSADCPLPFDYAIRSHCPFAPRCIEGSCAVVCPIADPFSTDGSWGSMQCETDDQCDCSGYASADLISCSCVEGGCVARVE